MSRDLNNISEANKLWADNMTRAKQATDSISKLNNTFINKATISKKMGGSVKRKKC